MRWKLALTTLCILLAWSIPALAQSPGASGDAELNAVQALTVEEADDGTYIRIQGTQVATFSVFKLDDPPRLFVDLSNSKLASEELAEEVHNGVISRVGLMEFEDSFQDVARLVVGFDKPAHYDVRIEDTEVIVFVDGADRQSSPQVAEVDETLQQREAELEDARQRLERTEARYRSEVREHNEAYSSAVGELENTREELEQVRQEMEELQQRLQASSGEERRQLERSIAERNQALEAARTQVEKRQSEVDELRDAMAELEAERDTERQRYEEAQKQAQQARREAEEAREQTRQAQLQAEQARDQADQARDQAQRARAQVEQLEEQIGDMGGEVAQAKSRIDEQKRELAEARRAMERLESQLEMARADGQDDEVERFEEERQRWQQIQAERQAELDEAQRQAQRTEDKLAERQRELEQAQQQAQRTEDKLAERQRELEQAQRRVRQTEKERDKLQEELVQRDEEIASLRAAAEEAKRQSEQREQRRGTQARAIPVDPADENTIKSVRLQTDDRGRTQIVVDLERPGNFRTTRAGDGRAVMILNDVILPSELERTLSSDAQGGAVRFVSSYAEDDGSVRMEADLRSDASEVIRQDGNRVVWEFAPQVAEEYGSEMADNRSLRRDDSPRRTREGQSVTSQPPNYPRVVTDPTTVNNVPGMGRRRVTIDMREADIQNVLRFMSSESGINIIAGDDVSGNVTMRLQGVPMEEAFLTILQSMQLGFEIRGNVLRVAPQEVLNQEEAARAEARAQARAVEPLEVFLLPVNYASASELTPQVEGLLSPRGSVSVDERTNTLIIKDVSGNLTSIRTLIETLDAQVPQVLIEARIVETNENFDRAIGIQWGGDFSLSQGSGNPTGLIFPNFLGMSGGATDSEAPVEGTSENPNYAVNLPAAAGTGSGGAIGLTMGSVGGAVNLNMRLSALEDAGYAKIISSPRILTLDNREATISQGTSIPISVVSAAGVQTVFVDATLELTVTPHVTPDGNVRMSIQATKAEPDFQNTGARGDPTIIQNQAETELLVDDGDTTVIGGIYTENTGHSVSAVPFLHRIPILGALFRAKSQTENRSELLIFITPRIVNRAEALGIMSTGTLESTVPMPEE